MSEPWFDADHMPPDCQHVKRLVGEGRDGDTIVEAWQCPDCGTYLLDFPRETVGEEKRREAVERLGGGDRMIEPTTNAGQHLWQHGHPQHGFKEAIAAVEHEAVSNYIQSAYFAADLVAAMSQVTTNAEALTIAVLAKMREKGSKRETIEGAEQ